jgi:hypothetical protein
MANLTKSLDLMTDLIKAFDGEAPFKQHLANDRALATVRSIPKEPVAPVAAPVHDHMAKIQELRGLLKDSYLKLTAMHNEMPLSDQQSSAVGELRNRIRPHIG